MTYSYRQEKELAQKAKDKLFELLGSKCKSCGEAEVTLLQADHIHGGGYKDRRNKRHYWRRMLAKVLTGDEELQLLCKNCHEKKTAADKQDPLNPANDHKAITEAKLDAKAAEEPYARKEVETEADREAREKLRELGKEESSGGPFDLL